MSAAHKMHVIGVLDFGGQYAHLIANRIRRLGAYSEVLPSDAPPSQCKTCQGLVFSGGPGSVYASDAPPFDPAVLKLSIPVLGICYGHQLMTHILGGKVSAGSTSEYGVANLVVERDHSILKGLEPHEKVWMSHGDSVLELASGFKPIARTLECRFAAVEDKKRRMWGFQFHPEVTHTDHGMDMLSNFLDQCGCKREWSIEGYAARISQEIRDKVGDRRVFLLVSGGVDSTVAFMLLNQVLGKNKVYGLHIDTGLMRKNESTEILEALKASGFSNLHIVDAAEQFLSGLKGVHDPEHKRRIIGEAFLKVKDAEVEKIGLDAAGWVLAQGTIYPDTIESGGTQNAAVIKTHHNRVDGIQNLMARGLIIEPLANLYKDEVRELGMQLGLSRELVWRHPFPGPGLGVRILCSDGQTVATNPNIVAQMKASVNRNGRDLTVLPIRSVGVQGDARTYACPAVLTGNADFGALEPLATAITNEFREVNRVLLLVSPHKLPDLRPYACDLGPQRVAKAQEADAQAHAVLRKHSLMDEVWQMPVLLLPLKDAKGNEPVVVRPVMSQEAMTARFAALPENVVAEIGQRLLNISGIGAVFYDITHKPPGTIEWE